MHYYTTGGQKMVAQFYALWYNSGEIWKTGGKRAVNELLKMYLIVCPLIFLGGFVDSVAGGGGLITLPAYMMAGVPVHVAAGTNKVVNGIGTATATVKFFRSGKIRVLIAVCAAIGALAGGYIGAEIAKLLSEGLLKGLMLVALPVVAVFLVVKKDFGQETGEKVHSHRYEIVVSLLIGLAIGCYDGMVGPGTGTFMIMAFTALLSLDMVTASGCAKVGNLASNIAAAVSFILGGKVMWALVIPAALCSVAGNYCGALYAIRGGGKKIKNMIFVVLGMLFVKMLVDLLAK